MYRSFTNRVFGGVCGGLAAVFPMSAWWFRAAFILLAIVTAGAFAALYVLLWWLLPHQSLAERRRGGAGRLLLVIILIVVTALGWLAQASGQLKSTTGQDLFWPVMLLALSLVFFLRQVRA
jgi:phage shock protein PspC (stress-responsive transcriptional regulator)